MATDWTKRDIDWCYEHDWCIDAQFESPGVISVLTKSDDGHGETLKMFHSREALRRWAGY